MYLESEAESAERIKAEVPGLANIAVELATTLKESRFLLDQLFLLCSQQNLEIEPDESEQNNISMKVALISNPQNVVQYARLVQLVFQLNYFSKCFEKAIKTGILPNQLKKKTERLYSKIEKFRTMIEKEYLPPI